MTSSSSGIPSRICLSGSKVRPAVVVSAPHVSQDSFIVPLTSRTSSLLPGEFLLTDWRAAGLNVPTAVKRGIYTVQQTFIVRSVGRLAPIDAERLERSLRDWLGFTELDRSRSRPGP